MALDFNVQLIIAMILSAIALIYMASRKPWRYPLWQSELNNFYALTLVAAMFFIWSLFS